MRQGVEPYLHLRPFERHSLVLLVAGCVYIVYGLLTVTIDVPTRNESLKILTYIAPIRAWGVIWVAAGLLALLSTRWPPHSKTWGYTGLTFVAAAWGSAFAVGIVFLDTSITSITGAVTWYLVAFLWWAISGLLNPGDVPRAE